MILDVVLGIAAVSFGLSGWRRGLVVGALSFAGFVGGGIAAMLLIPRFARDWSPGTGHTLLAAALVLVCALVGQVALTMLGASLRRILVLGPLRLLDSALGALLGVAGLLVVAWSLATAARTAAVPDLAREVGRSRVLRAVDAAMPDASTRLISSFRSLLDQSQFPQVFAGLAPERIVPVAPPDATTVAGTAVARAARSIVQVIGSAPSCDRRVEGSGFVYAARHVLTNAHVVAGVARPTVSVGGRGPALAARVVAFDARRDVAVLYVPRLAAPALALVPGAVRGDSAIVAGFPRGGPYRISAARVREQIRARGPDIYGTGQTTRLVLSLYAVVRPGNSGGPLLSPDGGVLGLVFATSVDDPRTGYALSVAEITPVARGAVDDISPVSTGGCAD